MLAAAFLAAFAGGAFAAEIANSDATVSGAHDYGSDTVKYTASGVSVGSGASVSAAEIRFAGSTLTTNGATLVSTGQLRVDSAWTGTGDEISAGSVWIGNSVSLEKQTWTVSGAVNFFNYTASVKIADSDLTLGDNISFVGYAGGTVELKDCATTTAGTSINGSFTVDGGSFTASGNDKNFVVGSGTFSVKNGATVDLTGVAVKLSGGEIETEGAVNVVSSSGAVQNGALNVSSLTLGSGTLSAGTLRVSSDATISVASGVTLNVGALDILCADETISAGTEIDLAGIFGDDSADIIEQIFESANGKITVTSASGTSYQCASASGGTSITVIPEPSAFGLLAGVAALAFCASRRRRKA